MKQYMQDRFIALGGLIIVGLWLTSCAEYEIDSSLFPIVCLLFIGFLLLLLGGESLLVQRRLKAAGKEGQEALPMNPRGFLVVTAAMAAYGLALPLLGFYTASAVFLLAVGFLWKGVKKQIIILFTVCFIIFLYVCFTILFNVPLPSGFFF